MAGSLKPMSVDLASLDSWRRGSGSTSGTSGTIELVLARATIFSSRLPSVEMPTKFFSGYSPKSLSAWRCVELDDRGVMYSPPGEHMDCSVLSIVALLLHNPWILHELDDAEAEYWAMGVRLLEILTESPIEAALEMLANTSEFTIGGSIACALRRVISKAALADRRPVEDVWHTPAKEAARIEKPHERVPVGAVVSLVEKLPGRVRLVVHAADGRVKKHDLGDAASPFLGSLHVRDGHMSFIQGGDAAHAGQAGAAAISPTMCACATNSRPVYASLKPLSLSPPHAEQLSPLDSSAAPPAHRRLTPRSPTPASPLTDA